jgi:CPA2 family monovalent cation:H+ antiporter-2
MNAHDFLKALSIVLAVAAVTTVLFQRLKQPVVLGYLLAGLIVGPHVPIPLVADPRVVHTLSELGVILLMYSLGLEFSLRKLADVGPTAGLTAVIQCSLMAWLGYLAGRGLGWSPMDSVFTGAALAVSSTIIIVKAFEEQKVGGRLKDLVVGVLVVQDLISILAMAALTTLIKDGHFSPGALVQAGGRLFFFTAAVLILGLWLVPKGVRAAL